MKSTEERFTYHILMFKGLSFSFPLSFFLNVSCNHFALCQLQLAWRAECNFSLRIVRFLNRIGNIVQISRFRSQKLQTKSLTGPCFLTSQKHPRWWYYTLGWLSFLRMFIKQKSWVSMVIITYPKGTNFLCRAFELWSKNHFYDRASLL